MWVDTTLTPAGPTDRAGSLHLAPRDLGPAPTTPGLEAIDQDADVVSAIGASGHEDHRHPFHQFLFVPVGRAQIWADGASHLLSAETGLWLPAGTWHAARFDADCLVVPLDFDPARWPLPLTTALPIAITTRRRRLLLAHLRAGTACGHEVFSALLTEPRLPLPEPRSSVPRAVAHQLRGEPGDQRTVDEWARDLHVGATTLRRAFVNETGLNFSQWRTRLRLNLAVDLLARGHLVGAVAQQVGFTSTNGFIIAFRRHFGTTPKAYAESELLVG